MRLSFRSFNRLIWIPSSQNQAGVTGIATLPSLLVIGLGVFWWYTYSGPFRWLAELQIRIFGAFESSLTVAVICLALFAPLMLLGSYIEARGWIHDDKSAPIDTTRYNLPISLATLAVMATIGGWYIAQRTPSGDPVEVTFAEIEQGVAIPDFVSLEGQALHDLSLALERNHSETGYTPLVPQTFQEGDPVVVYVENYPRDAEGLAGDTHRGVLLKNGLPGVVREGFKSSMAPPSQPHFVLCYPTTGLAFLPNLLFSAGGILGLAAVATGFFIYRGAM